MSYSNKQYVLFYILSSNINNTCIIYLVEHCMLCNTPNIYMFTSLAFLNFCICILVSYLKCTNSEMSPLSQQQATMTYIEMCNKLCWLLILPQIVKPEVSQQKFNAHQLCSCAKIRRKFFLVEFYFSMPWLIIYILYQNIWSWKYWCGCIDTLWTNSPVQRILLHVVTTW